MDEITRTLKALFLLIQHMNMAEEDCTSEIEERLEAIKCVLGSWFIGDYQLYQGSQALFLTRFGYRYYQK